MQTPFMSRVNAAQRILIAGCGGGFDIYSGIPLAHSLATAGKFVVMANLSFSNLPEARSAQVSASAWRITSSAAGLAYFPEKWLCEWLEQKGMTALVYAFAKTGAKPLAEAYRAVLAQHDIDLVILIDGGTDSIIFGDEPGLGTVTEDAVSLVAAHAAAGERVLLAALGFGIDHFHGVSHHSFLENVARLTREGGFLGAHSVVAGTEEADAFLDLVAFANERRPEHASIVNNSIAGAIRGEFGDVHATDRTKGSALFVNPLMAQYWTFSAGAVVRLMTFADSIRDTETFEQADQSIQTMRRFLRARPRRPIPL